MQFIVLILLSILLFNGNYTLLYFKKRVFVLYWKLYNMTVFYVSICYLRYRFNTNQFSQGYTLTESIIYSIIVILYANILIVTLSLYQGFLRYSQNCVLVIAIFFICGILYRIIYHYFHNSIDYTRNVFENQVSIRSIIISAGVDMAVWITYQVYLLIRYPDILFLPNIRINWIEK